jgi:CheY-like chemotaxis protein
MLVSCISRYLKAAHYTTSSAGDGDAGEQRARAEHPDLILLDMRMEGRSGLATLAALRNAPETRAIPVVMLSGSDEDFDTARRTGATGVLLKPFRQAELVGAIQRALSKAEPVVHRPAESGVHRDMIAH